MSGRRPLDRRRSFAARRPRRSRDRTTAPRPAAASRATARQLIRHKHFQVNGKPVNIPSYLVNPGDVVSPRGKSKELLVIQESIKNIDSRQMVPYLEIDTNKLQGELLEIPGRDAIPAPVDEQLIVELYSK